MDEGRVLSRLSALAIGLVALPAGIVIGLVLAGDGADGGSEQAEPLVVLVTEFLNDERRGVQLTFTWQPGPSLYAPAWAGTVGSVAEAVQLSDGDVIAVVGGVTRLAATTPGPFYRPLGAGAMGADVGWLHEFLTSYGFSKVPGGTTATPETMNLVTELAGELGVTGEVTAFDPSWVVWLPQTPYEIASLELAPGAPAPSEGSIIATTSSSLSAVDYQTLDGGPIEFDPGTAYVLTIGDLEVSLDATGLVTPDGLMRLSSALGRTAEGEGQGTVRREEPRPVWSIPTAAISSGAAGDLCIWVERQGDYEAVPIVALSSQAGVTYVEPGDSPPMLLTNPADVLASPSCPSS